MVAIADLERLLERVFERTSARVFRSRVQAVQVERRIERAMEAERVGRGTATTVPNRFRVRLHPTDLDDLAARGDSLDSLAADLADRALAFARLHAYHLVSRPTVILVADPSAERRMVEVDASVWRPTVRAATDGVPAASADAPLGAPAGTRGPDPLAVPVAELDAIPAPHDDGLASLVAPRPAHADRGGASPSPPTRGGIRDVGDRPYAVRPAVPPSATALLRVTEPGGREREVRVEGQTLTLGRATDNGLVLPDARVSRHHGRFTNRNGTLVYTDLGSTNGSRVNGTRVDEIVLGAGDRLQVGNVVVVVDQLPH
jgi:FhaA, N-terminal domain/FHA domain